MEKSFCPLCSSTNCKYKFSDKGYRIMVCSECGLFFLDPLPNNVHQHVEEYDYNDLCLPDLKTQYGGEVYFYKQYLWWFEKELKGAKRVLDIGCGTGHLLECLKKHVGLERMGVELNRARAEYAMRMAECEIYQVPIEELRLDNMVDVVIMVNVISHIPSFDSLFTSLENILKPGGKVLIYLGECFENVKKSDNFDWGIPDHVQFFGINTINYLFLKYGYNTLSHERFDFADYMFSKDRLYMPGRSNIRNIIKRIIIESPFICEIFKKAFQFWTGGRIVQAFVVGTKNSKEIVSSV